MGRPSTNASTGRDTITNASAESETTSNASTGNDTATNANTCSDTMIFLFTKHFYKNVFIDQYGNFESSSKPRTSTLACSRLR